MDYLHENEQLTGAPMPYDQAEGEWIAVEKLSHSTEHIGGMVVGSPQLRNLVKTVKRLGPYRQTVLIEGESGTGKELIARALHNFGNTPSGPFVTFNCSNLVDSLAEAQLFGHLKGAFTDAREDALGYFRSANGGTLFLDEIGELPLQLQPKLLRAVENHEVQPVGSSNVYKVDIRLVAATNRNLRVMMKTGQFREDLYYRLNSAALLIPPLRERAVAIPAFIAHFVEHYNKLFAKRVSHISRDALAVLCAYPWPGNIRELSHVIETVVLMTDSNRIAMSDLPAPILSVQAVSGHPLLATMAFANPELERITYRAPSVTPSDEWSQPTQSPLLLDDVIKTTLLKSLEQTRGNRRRAADLLGVSRSTLYRMLARYNLNDAGRPGGKGIFRSGGMMSPLPEIVLEKGAALDNNLGK